MNCPKCKSERVKHSARIWVCYACNNSWLGCPKCGSEMERRAAVYTLSVPERWVCKCGHEEKVGEKK